MSGRFILFADSADHEINWRIRVLQ